MNFFRNWLTSEIVIAALALGCFVYVVFKGIPT